MNKYWLCQFNIVSLNKYRSNNRIKFSFILRDLFKKILNELQIIRLKHQTIVYTYDKCVLYTSTI